MAKSYRTRHQDADYADHAPQRRRGGAGGASVVQPSVRPVVVDEHPTPIQLSERMAALAQNQTALAGKLAATFPGQAGMSTGVSRANRAWRPELDKISDAHPPLNRIYGVSGTPIYDGVINDPAEYNRDFYWRDGVEKYDQMYRSDAQVRQSLAVMSRPIRRATYDVQPVSDAPIDQEIASFVKSALMDDMCMTTNDGEEIIQNWDDILRHLLLMYRYGFSVMEMVWRRDKDGWTKWGQWAPILPRTVWRWWTGGNNELLGIQQYAYKDDVYQLIEIPAQKIIRVAYDQDGSNYDGISPLRSAYPHWFYKQQYYAIQSVGFERTNIPMPVITLPAGASPADFEAARIIGENLRANEKMHVRLPAGWDIKYLQGAAHSTEIDAAIEHHDRMIARNVGAMFLNLGGQRGAMNLDKSQTQTFMQALQADADYLCERISSGPIRKLVRANYDGVKVFPRLIVGKISTQDLDTLSETIGRLAGFVNPDPTLEDWLREQLGIPQAAPVEINSTNPSGGSDDASQDDGKGDQGSDQKGDGKGDGGDDNGGGSGGDSKKDDSTKQAESADSWLLNDAFDAVERAILHLNEQDRAQDDVALAQMDDDSTVALGIPLRQRHGWFNGSESTGAAHKPEAHARPPHTPDFVHNLEAKAPHNAVEELRTSIASHKLWQNANAHMRNTPEHAQSRADVKVMQRRLAFHEKLAGVAQAHLETPLAARSAQAHEPAPMRHVMSVEDLHTLPGRLTAKSPVADGRDLNDATHLGRDGQHVIADRNARARIRGIEMDMRNSAEPRLVVVSPTGRTLELGASAKIIGKLTPEQRRAFRGGALVINHPLGGTPTLAEMKASAYLNARQLRVVTPFYRHAVSRVGRIQQFNKRQFYEFASPYAHTRSETLAGARSLVHDGLVSQWNAARQFGHAVWSRLGQGADLHYTRAAWDETSALMAEAEDDDTITLAGRTLRKRNGQFDGSESTGEQTKRQAAKEAAAQRHAQREHEAERVAEGANKGAGRTAGRAKGEGEGVTRRANKAQGEGPGRARGDGSRIARVENQPKTSDIVRSFKPLRQIRGYEVELANKLDARVMLYVYGHRQLRQVVENHSLESIRNGADLVAHRNPEAPGPKSMTRKGMVDYIYNTTTHESRQAIMSTIRAYRDGGKPGDLLGHEGKARGRMNANKEPKAPRQPAAPKAPKQSAAERNAAEIAGLHEASAKWQQEHHATPEDGIRGDLLPQDHVRFEQATMIGSDGEYNVRGLTEVYGEYQLGRALSRYTPARLKQMATEGGVANHSGSKEQLVSRLTAHATGGRYSANFAKELAAEKESARVAKAAAAERRAAKAAERAAKGAPKARAMREAPQYQDLIPVASAKDAKNLEYGPDGELNAYGLRTLYGDAQLHNALRRYTHATLKEFARTVMERNPGTQPKSMARAKDVEDYIVATLTKGAQKTNTPEAAPATRAQQRATTALTIEHAHVQAQIGRAQTGEERDALITRRETIAAQLRYAERHGGVLPMREDGSVDMAIILADEG